MEEQNWEDAAATDQAVFEPLLRETSRGQLPQMSKLHPHRSSLFIPQMCREEKGHPGVSPPRGSREEWHMRSQAHHAAGTSSSVGPPRGKRWNR